MNVKIKNYGLIISNTIPQVLMEGMKRGYHLSSKKCGE